MIKIKKILLIEDDEDLGSLLCEYLKLNSFEVDLADTGKQAIGLFNEKVYDLITIDIMLPDTNGIELAKYFRAAKPDIPFIFITAKNRKEEIISGLKTGAEDYITKPFDPEELVLRLNIALRRNSENTDKELIIANSTLIPEQMILNSGDANFKLTQKEYDFLAFLIQNKNKLVTRKTILEKFWGEDDYFKGRSMDVFISRFRKYLSNDHNVQLETYRGTGFILRDNVPEKS